MSKRAGDEGTAETISVRLQAPDIKKRVLIACGERQTLDAPRPRFGKIPRQLSPDPDPAIMRREGQGVQFLPQFFRKVVTHRDHPARADLTAADCGQGPAIANDVRCCRPDDHFLRRIALPDKPEQIVRHLTIPQVQAAGIGMVQIGVPKKAAERLGAFHHLRPVLCGCTLRLGLSNLFPQPHTSRIELLPARFPGLQKPASASQQQFESIAEQRPGCPVGFRLAVRLPQESAYVLNQPLTAQRSRELEIETG